MYIVYTLVGARSACPQAVDGQNERLNAQMTAGMSEWMDDMCKRLDRLSGFGCRLSATRRFMWKFVYR